MEDIDIRFNNYPVYPTKSAEIEPHHDVLLPKYDKYQIPRTIALFHQLIRNNQWDGTENYKGVEYKTSVFEQRITALLASFGIYGSTINEPWINLHLGQDADSFFSYATQICNQQHSNLDPNPVPSNEKVLFALPRSGNDIAWWCPNEHMIFEKIVTVHEGSKMQRFIYKLTTLTNDYVIPIESEKMEQTSSGIKSIMSFYSSDNCIYPIYNKDPKNVFGYDRNPEFLKQSRIDLRFVKFPQYASQSEAHIGVIGCLDETKKFIASSSYQHNEDSIVPDFGRAQIKILQSTETHKTVWYVLTLPNTLSPHHPQNREFTEFAIAWMRRTCWHTVFLPSEPDQNAKADHNTIPKITLESTSTIQHMTFFNEGLVLATENLTQNCLTFPSIHYFYAWRLSLAGIYNVKLAMSSSNYPQLKPISKKAAQIAYFCSSMLKAVDIQSITDMFPLKNDDSLPDIIVNTLTVNAAGEISATFDGTVTFHNYVFHEINPTTNRARRLCTLQYIPSELKILGAWNNTNDKLHIIAKIAHPKVHITHTYDVSKDMIGLPKPTRIRMPFDAIAATFSPNTKDEFLIEKNADKFNLWRCCTQSKPSHPDEKIDIGHNITGAFTPHAIAMNKAGSEVIMTLSTRTPSNQFAVKMHTINPSNLEFKEKDVSFIPPSSLDVSTAPLGDNDIAVCTHYTQQSTLTVYNINDKSAATSKIDNHAPRVPNSNVGVDKNGRLICSMGNDSIVYHPQRYQAPQTPEYTFNGAAIASVFVSSLDHYGPGFLHFAGGNPSSEMTTLWIVQNSGWNTGLISGLNNTDCQLSLLPPGTISAQVEYPVPTCNSNAFPARFFGSPRLYSTALPDVHPITFHDQSTPLAFTPEEIRHIFESKGPQFTFERLSPSNKMAVISVVGSHPEIMSKLMGIPYASANGFQCGTIPVLEDKIYTATVDQKTHKKSFANPDFTNVVGLVFPDPRSIDIAIQCSDWVIIPECPNVPIEIGVHCDVTVISEVPPMSSSLGRIQLTTWAALDIALERGAQNLLSRKKAFETTPEKIQKVKDAFADYATRWGDNLKILTQVSSPSETISQNTPSITRFIE